jgi:hypothetical protein
VAVTALAAVIDTLQVPPPLQPPPDQPAKVDPSPALAARTTVEPGLNVCEQTDPQLIPVGSDVTVPLPFPAMLTVRV